MWGQERAIEKILCKICKIYMAVWASNVNITDPLVVTAESALSKSPRGKSRELWATSGSHFPDDLKIWTF